MVNKVLNTLNKYGMISSGDEVYVGISGGADSVCLLHILHCLKDRLNFTLKAIHIDHSLRGNESDRDREFTASFCKALDIELFIYKEDIKNGAKKHNMGIEQYAREVRYKRFYETAKDSKIATAHNMNDNAETVLFNLTRGTSVNGLSGIPPVRDNIIRPLIDVSRAEIEQYINENSLEYVTDSSNLTCDYTRNVFRHKIIPQLEQINPSVISSVSRLSENAALIYSYIKEQACDLIEKDIAVSELKTMHKALINEYLYQLIFKQLGVKVEQVHIKNAYNAIVFGGIGQLPDDYFISVVDDRIYITKEISKTFKEFSVPFAEGIIETPYKKYETYVVSIDDYKKINNLSNKNCIDYDKIPSGIVLRSRKAGDKIRLPRRNCTKSVKQLFNENKLLPQMRASTAIIADENRVYWVEGFGSGIDAAVCGNTKRVLIISAL